MSTGPHSPEYADIIAAAHPLAQRLIERHGGDSDARVLELGTGSGRNLRALRAAGLSVVSLNDATASSSDAIATLDGGFSAALSTHALLHGTASSLPEMVRAIAKKLKPDSCLYATFGSSRDARFGCGERIDDRTYAPLDGDERGIAHMYFDEQNLRALLEPRFTIEALEERDVDRVAGSWAHSHRPLSEAVHWFVVACRREDPELGKL